jgi:hypothetical protein
MPPPTLIVIALIQLLDALKCELPHTSEVGSQISEAGVDGVPFDQIFFEQAQIRLGEILSCERRLRSTENVDESRRPLPLRLRA